MIGFELVERLAAASRGGRLHLGPGRHDAHPGIAGDDFAVGDTRGGVGIRIPMG